MYLLDTCMSSLEKCVYSSPLAIFKLGLWGDFLVLSCWSSLCSLGINPLSHIRFENSFFHSLDWLFILLMVSFAVWSFLVWYNSTCLFFPFDAYVFGVISKKLLLRPMSRLSPMFFSKSFIVSGLMLKSLIHFELIFMWSVRRIPFQSFRCRYPLFQNHL